MRLMIVASKYDVNNKLAGYMVADVEDLKGGKINANVISTANIINTPRSGKVTIDNATIQNGSLVGTNGSLDRYTKLNCNNMIMDGKTPLIVISQIENIGYKLLDVNGKIIKYNNTETVKLVEKYGIANGKLVQPEDSDSYISPIQGQYPITKLNNNENGRIRNHSDQTG